MTDPRHIWLPDPHGGATRCIRCKRVKNPVNAALPCERAEEPASA